MFLESCKEFGVFHDRDIHVPHVIMKTDSRGTKRKRYEPEQKDIRSRIIGKLVRYVKLQISSFTYQMQLLASPVQGSGQGL